MLAASPVTGRQGSKKSSKPKLRGFSSRTMLGGSVFCFSNCPTYSSTMMERTTRIPKETKNKNQYQEPCVHFLNRLSFNWMVFPVPMGTLARNTK
jgi:hypothetical protein